MAPSSNGSLSSSITKRNVRPTRTLSGTSQIPPGASPHLLGGSKTLIAERFRREQVEQDLVQTRQTLKSIATELVPQVDELAEAVKVIQLTHHNQVDVNTASHDIVETLLNQVKELEDRDVQLEALVDERIATLLQHVTERFRTEKHEMQQLVAQVQDAQDELLADFRLLHHEYTATCEFLSNLINVVDDTVSTLRTEMEQFKENHISIHHQTQTKMKQLDEKLFVVDKEVLKLKLVLPSSISAQIPPQFPTNMTMADATKAATASLSDCRGLGGGQSMVQKLQELASDIESIKTDLVAYRQADRQQFDAITNRMREMGKTQQTMRRDVDVRCLELQGAYDQIITRVPSELSKRLLSAQAQWHEELQTLRATVHRLDSSVANKSGCWESMSLGKEVGLYDIKALQRMDTEVQRHLELIKELQHASKRLEATCEVNEITTKTLASVVTRLTKDLLGLYDWTNTKMMMR